MFSRELSELTEFICDEEEDISRRYKGEQQVKMQSYLYILLFNLRPFKLQIFGVDLSKAPISSMYRWTGGRKTKGSLIINVVYMILYFTQIISGLFPLLVEFKHLEDLQSLWMEKFRIRIPKKQVN